MTSLDAVDRQIVELLEGDGRMSVNHLAAQANVSRATAYARLKRLRDDRVITGFRAVVDPEALGRHVTALLLVNVDQHDWRAARDEMRRLPGLQYLALTSGGFDMVLLVRVADVQMLRDVVLVRLHGLPQVRSSQTVFVLDDEGLV